MKIQMRPWKWILACVVGLPVLLVAILVLVRLSEAQGMSSDGGSREANAFGPPQVWEAASPFQRLARKGSAMPMVKATVGLDLGEAPATGAPVLADTLKLIRTGDVSLEVKDFDAAALEVTRLAVAAGGYVTSTDVRRGAGGARMGSVTVRVPADHFLAAGSAVARLGKVLSQHTNTEDVTKEYQDLETRLRVKRDAAARVREILRTRAGNLNEVLNAEKELARITEEIETAEGQRQFYDHQIRLSTLIVNLQEPQAVTVASAWSSLGEALGDGPQLISGSLAVLLRIVLVLLPWGLIAYGAWKLRAWIKRRRLAKAPAPAAGEA